MKKKDTPDDIQIREVAVDEERPKRKKTKTAKKNAKIKPAVSPEYTDRKQRNRELVRVSYLFVLMFFSLAAYFVYFQVYRAEDINSNSYNTKQDSFQDQIIRGSIISADGQKLAGTNVEADGTETRLYPFDQVFSHVVGYASNGGAGIEATSNYDLMTSNASILEQIRNDQQEQKVRADSVVLTLDSRIQQAAYDALGMYNGSIVVMEPDTGKIIAMVSKPDFNPNTISEDWESLIQDDQNSSLFNRASQAQYPPGSVFKILTTLAYLREHPDDYQDFHYNCDGVISRGDVRIPCYGGAVHGSENLEEAFMQSCNGAFAEIGMELNNAAFRELCEDFLFNQELPIAMPASQSRFLMDDQASYGEEMMTAIGQGDTVVSPLEMALVTAAVANGGNMMTPYYIDRIETYDEDPVKQYKPALYKEVMSTEEAAILTDLMEKTVEGGTASTLAGQSYSAAGKTGSAEYEINGEEKGTHSWFVGFSNVENPDIVISVIAEDGGSGSQTAVPIAKQVLDAYYSYN